MLQNMTNVFASIGDFFFPAKKEEEKTEDHYEEYVFNSFKLMEVMCGWWDEVGRCKYCRTRFEDDEPTCKSCGAPR